MLVTLKNPLVQKTLAALYLNKDLADFHFTIQDEIVPVNKCILAATSPVFDVQFFGSMKEKGDSVEMKLSTSEVFKEFLQFFYLTDVTLKGENIEEIVKLADYYDIIDFVNTCAGLLVNKLTSHNLLSGYKLAIALKNVQLKEDCERLISVTIVDIFESDAFKCCDQQVLHSILELDKLACKETDVLDACLTWARMACQKIGLDETKAENLKNRLGDCLHLIRFGTFKMEEFSAYGVLFDGLFTFEDYKNVLREIVESRVIPRIDPLKEMKSNDKNVLQLRSESVYSKDGKRRWMHPESFKFRFSVNFPVILCRLYFMECTPRTIDFKIVEMSTAADSNSESSTEKVIFDCPIKLDTSVTWFEMNQTCIIYPQKQYEIRYATNDHSIIYQTRELWETEYYLKDQVVLKINEVEPQQSVFVGLDCKRI